MQTLVNARNCLHGTPDLRAPHVACKRPISPDAAEISPLILGFTRARRRYRNFNSVSTNANLCVLCVFSTQSDCDAVNRGARAKRAQPNCSAPTRASLAWVHPSFSLKMKGRRRGEGNEKTKGDPLAMPARRTTPLSQTWPQLLQPLGFTRRTIIWNAPSWPKILTTIFLLPYNRTPSLVPEFSNYARLRPVVFPRAKRLTTAILNTGPMP